MPVIEEVTTYSPLIYEAVKNLLAELDTTLLLTEDRFKKIIETENSHLFIIKVKSSAEEENGNIAGMLTLGIYYTPGGTKAWIEDVVVNGAYRGEGYGRMLVQHAIDFAKLANIDMLMLTSRPSRTAANQLYQNMGFKIKQTNLYFM